MKLSILCCNVYPGQDQIDFMLRNLAFQTQIDNCEILVVDAFQEQNAGFVKRLANELLLPIIHVPACLHSHVGSWMHWEVLNNAALFASSDWLLYFGVYRYMHREVVATVIEKAKQDICTVLAQGAATADAFTMSPDQIEQQYKMHCRSEVLSHLTQTGFFSVPRAALINELNGHNEALILHHWVDNDLGERARNVRLNVQIMRNALVRIERSGHYWQMFNPKPTCTEVFKDFCAAWLIDQLRDYRHIQVPVERFVHSGFEWVRCHRCGTIAIEDSVKYFNRLSRPEYKKAPINVYGVGRNLETLAKDIDGLAPQDRTAIIESSHTNPRYLV